jgi:glycosyltransferase involved in cell wall biosynthesis
MTEPASQDATTAAPVPKISVLMPVYNGAAFVKESIESVLAQSFTDFELVVVDDGSIDATPTILAEMAARDARMRVVTKANSGISETLNVGLEATRAPWIARLDADDLMLPQRLERQWDFVTTQPDIVAAGSYFTVIDRDSMPRDTHFPLPRTREELAERLAQRETLTFTHPTMIYLRDVVRCLGGYRKEFEPCEDADLFARMLAEGGTILIQPEVLTWYRVHPGSISSRKMTEQFTTLRYIYHNFYAVRDGGTAISREAFEELRARRSVREKLAERLMLTSEYFYRAYTAAKVEGRTVKALACLGFACLFRPQKAVRRFLRSLAARNAQIKPADPQQA